MSGGHIRGSNWQAAAPRGKIPCIFPCYRAESGSLETLSSAIESAPLVSPPHWTQGRRHTERTFHFPASIWVVEE